MLHMSKTKGGPYTPVMKIEKCETVEADYKSSHEDGTAETEYFVMTAVSKEGFESDYSNEVFFTFDYLPIESAVNLSAELSGDEITFTWNQGDIERVREWKLFYSETEGGPYEELSLIEYTGQPGPQYSTTSTMTVQKGEKKTFYFVLVTFNILWVFSENSNEVSVTIDRTVPDPVYNFKLKVVAE